MSSENVQTNNYVDNTIFEKHITKYINGMAIIILNAFIILFFADVVISILVYFGYFPFQLRSITGGIATYKEFLIGQILNQVFTTIPFLIFFLSYKKVDFNTKKTLLCALTLTTTAILCFFHWKNQYISFLFAIPVVITSPLDKTRNKITVIISEAFVILYAFFHNLFHVPEINYLVAAVSTTTLGMFYFVSLKIHSTMEDVFGEIKEYKNIQDVLYNKIAHDVLTGALSKSALDAEMENFSNYKSLAFLDIDNFKIINDQKGHHTGDCILKLLTMCLKSNEVDLYRYGGDEFVILSQNCSPLELKKILEAECHKLSLASKELYTIEVTLSIGIVSIDTQKSPQEIIEKGDKLMYASKHNGRNRITVQN